MARGSRRGQRGGADEGVDAERNALLKRIYYDASDPGGLGGVRRLFNRARELDPAIRFSDVREFLASQRTYSLHRPFRRRFARNPTLAQGIDYQWQADLADVHQHAKANDGVKFLLTVVDVFSRYAWVVPVRSKTGDAVREALKDLLRQAAPRRPKKLQTDKGKEFLNQQVQSYLKEQGVEHFTSNSDQKAALVERFNRTLKERLERYSTSSQSSRYIEILPKLLASYNGSYHRAIGTSPHSVSPKNEQMIWRRLYGKYAASGRWAHKAALSENDAVRISRVKGVFEKGYTPGWTEERFRVSQRKPVAGRTVYKLRDEAGEPIEGQFYPEEVQRVIPDDVYLIEKVLQKRKRGRRTEFLVKWLGYPDKFNSWVGEKELLRVGDGGDRTG